MILTEQEFEEIARSLSERQLAFVSYVTFMTRLEERALHAASVSASAAVSADVFTRMYAELVKPMAIPEVTQQEPNPNPTLTQSEPTGNPLGFSGLYGEAEVRS